jgi:tetratricopeptide (TPR) repeat protein
MIFHWFNASEAENIASELADQLAPRSTTSSPGQGAAAKGTTASQQNLLRRAAADARLAGLNFYKKARFANSFKWRLLENGMEPRTADQMTRSLLVHLSQGAATVNEQRPAVAEDAQSAAEKIPDLLRRGNKALAGGAYGEARELYQAAVDRDPANAMALNNLGAALCKIGNYAEAEQHFRRALSLDSAYAEANCNLGNVLRWIGNLEESEIWLRRALKANPNYVDARISLGLTLTFLGRIRDAKARFEKVLKAAPREADALFGMGLIAKVEGRFADAEALFRRVLEQRPRMASAWAVLVTLRRMTAADSDWLRAAKELLDSGLTPPEETELRFAIGKYHDDLDEFDEAFGSFEAGNAMLKTSAMKYDRKGRESFVDDMARVYTKDAIAAVGKGASESAKPVFVLGMPRSGASLIEHILASHPSIAGKGELGFWYTFAGAHEAAMRGGLLDPSTRKTLADDYLRLLETDAGEETRIIDKTMINSDYMGTIHSVFPSARFIYVQRDPIDTCLSCYFQQFGTALNFTMDLSDLAHYYKTHRKLFRHWQSVLPADRILVVPYEELVVRPEEWTRKMLEFLGLDWNERCLSFHDTPRVVAATSTWQVRQKIYTRSVGRSQSYKKHIGPLKALTS